MRRSINVVAALSVLSCAGIMVAAPSALANIVIGQSIAGVKLGSTEAQVTALLGPPTSKESAGPAYPGVVNITYPTSVGLHFSVTNGRVSDVLSFSKKQKTSKGITIGSSRAQLKRAYPKAKCAEGPYGPQSLYCAVLARFHGRKSFTSFLFGTAKGNVTEIELGYGVGLAQELKEQRKNRAHATDDDQQLTVREHTAHGSGAGRSVRRAAGWLWLQWIESKQLDHASDVGQHTDAIRSDSCTDNQLDYR